MAVDHYDDDYGETLAEHLTAEFGDDIATSVTTGATLSPQLHTTLLNQVDHAVHTRRILYTSLENEDARLSDAHTTLTSLNDTTTTVESTAHHTDDFETLRENWETIDSLQSQLDTLVKEHQTRRSNVPVRGDTKAFYAYLYEQLETTHPVLTDALTFDETLKTLDQNITHKLTTTA